MAIVFLSYSWTDNGILEGAREDKWVTQFREDLERHLRTYKGWHPKDGAIVWQDVNNIRGIGRIEDQIALDLDKVWIFCAVVTNSYLGSDWCVQELDRFVGRVLRECKRQPQRPRPKEVISKVVRAPTDYPLPRVLRSSLGHTLFQNGEGGAPLLLEADSKEYKERVAIAAHEMYEVMKRLTAQQAPRGIVYFCEPSGDANGANSGLTMELRSKGYTIITANDEEAPGTPEGCRRLIRERMAQALMTVHLVGDYAPDNGTAFMPEIEREELKIALELAVEGEGPPLFLWRYSPLQSGMAKWPKRPAIAETLKADMTSIQLRTSVLDLARLKTDLVRVLESLRTK